MKKELCTLGIATLIGLNNSQVANAAWWDWLNAPIKLAEIKSASVFVAKKSLFGITMQVITRDIPAGQYAPLYTYKLKKDGQRDDYFDNIHCKNTSNKYGPTFVRFNGKNNVCYSVFN